MVRCVAGQRGGKNAGEKGQPQGRSWDGEGVGRDSWGGGARGRERAREDGAVGVVARGRNCEGESAHW